MSHPPEFWTRLDDVVAAYPITIDRPKGTHHPDYPETIYPVDYGHLEGVAAMDGGNVDVWIGSTGYAQVDGIICTVDTARQDIEIKILFSCTPDEMNQIAAVMNTGQMSGLLITRK
nr:inorganic pyrophosphatase [Anaerolineae bacterium]